MTEIVDIDNEIDKAIIKSLEYSETRGSIGLLAGAIKKTVKEKFKIQSDEEVQSRIRELYKRNILIEVKPSQPRKDKKKVYALNKDICFSYICGPLSTEVCSRQVPIEIRRHHTEGLQEAIKNWIAFFPQPKGEYPFDPADRHQNDIKQCQIHLLFPDLENHLPEMGYDVCK